MKESILVSGRYGKVPVAIKRRVAVCGIDGFALHRPLNYECNGTNPEGWTISHVATGLKVCSENTMADAIETAEELLRKSGYAAPQRFQELVRRSTEAAQ